MNAKIYSYRRVSTLVQTEGISLDIQSDINVLNKLSEEYNLPISNRTFSDEGKSAYKGEHLESDKGELAWFINAVKNNEIVKGSILCVYSLDRLSRQSIGYAKQIYLDLTNNGISIYSILDNHLYKAHDASSEIIATIIFERAHNESKTKSARTVGTALKRAEDHLNGVRSPDGYAYLIAGGNLPWWVEYRDDKAVVPHPFYFDVAKKVHQMILSGMGNNKILNYLNENVEPPITRSNVKHPERRKEWKHSTIANFHKIKGLFGQRISTINGEKYVLDNYYPPIMSEDEWYQLQKIKQKRNYKGNRKRYSLVTGLGIATCLHCGAVVAAGCCSDTNNTRFFCAGKRNLQNGCDGFSFTGWWLEKLLLNTLVEDLYINPEVDTSDIDEQIDLLKAKKVKLDDNCKKVFSLFSEDSEDYTPDFVKQQFKESQIKLVSINSEIEELTERRNVLMAERNLFNDTAEQLFNSSQSIREQIIEALDDQNESLRKELRIKVQKLVKSIEIGSWNKKMYFRISLHNGVVRYALHPRGRNKKPFKLNQLTHDESLNKLRREVPSNLPVMVLSEIK